MNYVRTFYLTDMQIAERAADAQKLRETLWLIGLRVPLTDEPADALLVRAYNLVDRLEEINTKPLTNE